MGSPLGAANDISLSQGAVSLKKLGNTSLALQVLPVFFLRVSSGSNKIHKVLKPFSVVNVRPQVFQAIRRAEDVTVEDYMIGPLLLSATDPFGCI